ncbi:BMP family ABC transporter substrate-binding protein [Candidatus Acetothermia bacterium]|jgi:basic membrane protein A|nr:BMP family ABC transporter substrate-binding protein [Candidatus Acetothermia bacterium]MCI2426898.1 BMP family ABC transporter substrate-binding protein [Candidatus Acetothermia bacterium]MCI2428090.1 BMP family ABC transporter substrate-binding protein [Candidatus Acetothermia bacterium]
MNKRNLAVSLLLVSLLLVTIVGFTAYAARDRVGIVLSIGGLGDKSFNDFTFAGVRWAAEAMDVPLDYVEPAAIGDFEMLLRDFALTGQYKVIFAVGFLQADALAIVAPEFPEQKFIILDAVVDEPNVASLIFRENEGSFLVGIVAGMMTATNRVGFVGGMDVPIIRRFQAGFQAGVWWVNPDAIVDVTYVGSFGDPAGGKEHALAHYGAGVDIIFAPAGKTNLGVFDAAVATGNFAIGVDVDQAHIAPYHIIASMIKGIDTAAYWKTRAAIEGKFEPGIHIFGLAEGVAGICFLVPDVERVSRVYLPERVRAMVIGARQMIIDGLIIIPDEDDI